MAVTIPSNVRSFNTSRINCRTQARDRGFLYYPSDLRTIYNDPESEYESYAAWMSDMADAGVTMVTFRATGRNYTSGDGAALMEPPPYGTYNICDTALDPASGLPAYRSAQVTHPVAPATLAASNAQEIIEAAEQYGIGLWITLFEWSEFISGWDLHAWNEANDYIDGTSCEAQDQGFLTNWYEMFDDATAITAAKDKIQFFLDTFGDSEAIQAWEIIREGGWLCGASHWGTVWGAAHREDNIRGKMVPWFEEIAEYIRDNDSLERPICPAHVRTPASGTWDANPDEFYNVVNEINDIDNTEIQAGRGYFEGDVGDLITHLRAMQEKFPDHVCMIGECYPYALDREDPADEDSPFYISKEYQWVCACGEKNSWGAVRFMGIEESAVNVWISGGCADSDMWDIAAVTKNFQDCIDWSLWNDVNSQAWLNYISTGAAGTEYVMSWGDGEHVMMMLKFDTGGSKTVTVSNLTNNDTHEIQIFNWVSGALVDTQEGDASDNSLSFTYNVTSYDNILIAYLEYTPDAPPPPPPPAVWTISAIGLASYKMRFYSPAGVLVAETSDFWHLGYTKRVNYPGLLTFNMHGEHAAVALLSNRSQIEVWRRNQRRGIDWYCDFYGLYLSQERQYTDRDIFTAYCPGQMWFLSTRIVAWYAATADRAAFTSDPAETIMKTLVDYNACANATTGNSRLRDGAVTGLSIQADGANGNTLDWNCAYKNLLTELQGLALVAGGDFDLIKTAAQAWQFRWYTGQRGTDRSATVIFSLNRGNMSNPHYRYGRIGEKTAAIVGGKNEKDNRDIVIRTGTDYAAGNNIEVFVDAGNLKTTAAQNAAGDRRLDELQARDAFSFTVEQTASCLYGADYELGDLVTARAFDVEGTYKIIASTVTLNEDGTDQVDIETEAQ